MDIRCRKPCLPCILRILVGCVFILSAISKYVSIDAFDLYLYEHHLFGYNLTGILSRLLTGVECVLGIFLIAGIRIRETFWLTILMLAGFTLYLLLQPLLFNLSEDDCHCFGNWIHFSRWQSVGKNVVLCLLLLPARPKGNRHKKWHRWAAPLIVCVSILSFMFINPPDFIYRKLYGETGKVDTELYYTTLKKNGLDKDFQNGKKLICFYSTGCGHCRNADTKMELMMRFHRWQKDDIHCIFWQSDRSEADIASFFEKNNLTPLPHSTLPVDTFLQIVNGKMPTILFSDNGKIVRSINHIQMDEKEMDRFLKGN